LLWSFGCTKMSPSALLKCGCFEHFCDFSFVSRIFGNCRLVVVYLSFN
jgi:hypothetical protein